MSTPAGRTFCWHADRDLSSGWVGVCARQKNELRQKGKRERGAHKSAVTKLDFSGRS